MAASDESRPNRSDSLVEIVHDLLERTRVLEAKINKLEQEIITNTVRMQEGLSGGAKESIIDLKTIIREMQNELRTLESRSDKLQGGGFVIYALLTAVGGAVGWLLSHLGLR